MRHTYLLCQAVDMRLAGARPSHELYRTMHIAYRQVHLPQQDAHLTRHMELRHAGQRQANPIRLLRMLPRREGERQGEEEGEMRGSRGREGVCEGGGQALLSWRVVGEWCIIHSSPK